MSTLTRLAAAACVALAALIAPAAHAGRPCEGKPLQVDAVTRGMALAQHTAEALDRSGAQVLVLARAGQDLSKYGLRYSHLGFVYRDGAHWRVLHKLNHCGTADSALYRQGLGEFFMDSPFRYEAALVPLTPHLQARLLPILQDNARAAQLNERRYNMLAYPWSTAYQQSNQWAIETLAGALDPAASTRARAQAWLQLHDYRPTVLHLDAFTRLGARMTKANVAFDDHPNAKRFSDHIETVSVDSVFDWLQRVELASAPVEIR